MWGLLMFSFKYLEMPFPNVQLSSRPLHFIYICDCSGSMAAHGKMQSLNQSIRQSIPGMAEVAHQNPEARVLVRAVSFSDRAQWHISIPTPIDILTWTDLKAGGITAMGEALDLVAQQLKTPPMEERALPPVLVLISDGQPTDDFSSSLKLFMREPWAQKAVKISIAMGHDADIDVLQEFIGPNLDADPVYNKIPGDSGQLILNNSSKSPRKPLLATNATTLAQFIQWSSTAVINAATMPLTRQVGENQIVGNIHLPDLPPTMTYPINDVETLVW